MSACGSACLCRLTACLRATLTGEPPSVKLVLCIIFCVISVRVRVCLYCSCLCLLQRLAVRLLKLRCSGALCSKRRWSHPTKKYSSMTAKAAQVNTEADKHWNRQTLEQTTWHENRADSSHD